MMLQIKATMCNHMACTNEIDIGQHTVVLLSSIKSLSTHRAVLRVPVMTRIWVNVSPPRASRHKDDAHENE